LSGRGLCDELITRPEESYRMCCVAVCDLETSRIGAPYIYDISNLRVKEASKLYFQNLLQSFQTSDRLLRVILISLKPSLSTSMPFNPFTFHPPVVPR